MKNTGVYICRRIRVYDWLINHGFKPFNKRRDRDNHNYYVWMFDNSKQLQSCVTEYYQNINC